MPVAVSLLATLSGCGSDGRVAQPEDDFLDKVEAECRTAEKCIDKLDFAVLAADQIDQAVELLAEAVDALKDLDPPQNLRKDFDNMVNAIDDQVSEGNKLSRALADEDPAAIDTAIGVVKELAADTDKAADSLGALQCKALTPASELVSPLTTTPETLPPDTVPQETFPLDTLPPDTVAPDTVAPDTVAPDTVAPDTVPPGTVTATTTGDEIFPADLELTAVAPEGYEWIEYEQSDAAGLYGKSILGPLVTSYAGARAENIADGHTASIFAITISQEWTQEAADQYLFWEGVKDDEEDGFDTVTPAGFPVRQKFDAFDETDCLAYYARTIGISVCTFSGIDGLPILDAFIKANPG